MRCAVVFFSLCAGLFFAGSASADVLFRASLTGAQETPPVMTAATGDATLVFDEQTRTLACLVTTTGLVGTAAHIHAAPAGVPGGIVFPLSGGPTTWTGTFSLTPAETYRLFTEFYYVNVHTMANMNGEIRGQIVPAVTQFFAVLDGDQETPPVMTAAIGTASVTLHRPENRIDYVVASSGLTATDAHIHKAPRGTPGGVIVPLAGGPNFYQGSAFLTEVDMRALLDHGTYVNLHTAAHLNGEIRGQLVSTEAISRRAGNVDTGPLGSGPADVITVDGSAGDPIFREVSMSAGMATLGIAQAPAGGASIYAVWIFDGEATGEDLTPAIIDNGMGGSQFLGIATQDLPSNHTVLPGAAMCPAAFPQGFVSKALGSAIAAARVCLHVAPADPAAPASIMVNFPAGVYTVTGIEFDPNAPATGPRKVSLTNSVVVRVAP